MNGFPSPRTMWNAALDQAADRAAREGRAVVAWRIGSTYYVDAAGPDVPPPGAEDVATVTPVSILPA